MFPFLSKDDAVLVQPLYRNGNTLGFACEALLDSQVALKIRDREGHQAEVQVQQRRRADDQNWLYFAELREGALQPEPMPSYQWRQSERYPIGVRVRSARLPEYTALTEDLSAAGAQLSTCGPLQVGDEIELHLDLDCGFPAISVLGRVCWSKLTNPWRAGVAFVDLDPEHQRLLASYLAQRHDEDVMPGLASDQGEPQGVEPPMLEKLAYLQSSFDDGDTLVLNLLTNDEVMEIRFLNPRVVQTNLCSQLVSQILSKPTAEGQSRTLLIDPEGTTLIEIVSGAPEILCRGLPST